MKKLSCFKRICVFLSLSLFSTILLAQESKGIMGDPPANFYVCPTGLATWDAVSKSSQEFFFYKIFLDGVWKADVDTIFYPFGINEELIPGESYLAEIAALYSEGMSEKASFEFTYMPCDSFPSYNILLADFSPGMGEAILHWSDMIPLELIKLNQGYGAPNNGLFQSFGYAYGVAYDFSPYPDALVNAVDFHHASWGTNGTWDYNIHIVNWDNKTFISSIGPFQTTGNDIWELGVLLGDVSTDGAATVAILMEPLGNDPSDAYPCISGDSDPDPAGSIAVNLTDLNSFTPSSIGKFLMDLHIYTHNSGKNSNEITTIGSNVYFNDEFIAFVPFPDTTYIIDGPFPPGYYDFCVSKVFSEDEGLHQWESCPYEPCINDVYVPEDCITPENCWAENPWFDHVVIICWDAPNGFDPVWLQYDDGVNVDGIGGFEEFNYAAKWDPDQLDGFDGAVVSKIKFFPRTSESIFTLKIWKGDNASTFIYEQVLSNVEYDEWNEIILDQAVPIDISEPLWVGFYVESDGYPAGVGNYTGNPDGDLISLDGITWEHLSDYNLPFTWNLAIYCEAGNGKNIEIPNLQESKPKYKETPNMGSLTSHLNSPMKPKNTKEFMGYNIYRNGDKINDSLVQDPCYYDTVPNEIGSVCYEITAVYSICGESDPSNESCLDFMGTKELVNSCLIYPNPAKDHLMIESIEPIIHVHLFNQLGRIEMAEESIHAKTHQLALEKVSNGIYFIEIETKSGIQTSKVIIHK